MKTFTKIMAFVMAIMMMATLVGCGGGGDKSSTPSSDPSDLPSAPTKNLGGRTILLKGINVGQFFQEEGKSETGDEVNAMWDEVEKAFNCTITYEEIPINDFVNSYPSTIAAGLFFADLVYSQATYVRTWSKSDYGYVTAWDELSTIDVNSSKFNKPISDMLTYGGHVYGLDHDTWYHRMFGNFTSFLLANKSLLARENQPDIYTLIENNEWNWDKLREIAKNVTKDTDGDKQIDQWGFANSPHTNALNNNGCQRVQWDADNEQWVFGYQKDAAYNALDWALDLVHEDYSVATGWYSTVTGQGDPYAGTRDIFGGGNAAFINMDMEWLFYGDGERDWILDMEDDYMIVPFPLGPDNQNSEYFTVVGTNSWAWFIPSNVGATDGEEDPAKMKAAKEDVAMVYNYFSQPLPGTSVEENKEYIIENYLRGDEKSYEWYDYLKNHSVADRAMDMGVIAIIPLSQTLETLIEENSMTPAEAIEANAESFQSYIDDTMNIDPLLKPAA